MLTGHRRQRTRLCAPGCYQPGSRRGTVGHTLPGVSVRIIKPESIAGQEHLENLEHIEPLPANTEGMILVKGPIVMKGYLHRDDLTRKALCDGWYVTGRPRPGGRGRLPQDHRTADPVLQDRRRDGPPRPRGRSPQEAIGADEPVFAVTAVADGRDGDRLVVLHTTCDDRVNEALEKMRKLGLPNLYLPRRDSFVKVDALPLLGTGKLDLRGLKRIASEALGQSQSTRSPA